MTDQGGNSGALVLVVIIVVAVIALRALFRKLKRDKLMTKYADAQLVEKIMRRLIWQGMSTEQLVDSWGRPVAIDQKIFKTKTTLTYKYGQTGKNRFSRRVKLENGVVVGWEQK